MKELNAGLLPYSGRQAISSWQNKLGAPCYLKPLNAGQRRQPLHRRELLAGPDLQLLQRWECCGRRQAERLDAVEALDFQRHQGRELRDVGELVAAVENQLGQRRGAGQPLQVRAPTDADFVQARAVAFGCFEQLF